MTKLILLHAVVFFTNGMIGHTGRVCVWGGVGGGGAVKFRLIFIYNGMYYDGVSSN